MADFEILGLETLSDVPSFETQSFDLLTMQRLHMASLAMLGTIGKATWILPDYNPDSICHISLSQLRTRYYNEEVDNIRLRFGERYFDENDKVRAFAKYVLVAQTWNQVTTPCTGFTDYDSEICLELLDSLKLAKQSGYLPWLDSTLNYIRDPAKKQRDTLY